MIVGRFTHQDRVGTTKLRLAAFVPARLLVAGTYRLQSILLDSAGAAHTLYTSLRIVAPRGGTRRAPRLPLPLPRRTRRRSCLSWMRSAG